MNVVWKAEKNFFGLIKSHTNKMTEFGQVKDLHKIVESNNCKDENIIIFLVFVDGKAPIAHSFVNENGRHVLSINGTFYLDLLNEVVWHTSHSSTTRKEYWWMQNRTHTVLGDLGYTAQ